MPLYEFRCNECDRRFDALVRAGQPVTVACQTCESTNVRRLVSTFATVGGFDDTFQMSESASGGGCCGGKGGCACGR